MVLPFICNLLRRHPACRVLVHRPHGPRESCGDSPPTHKPTRGGMGSHRRSGSLLELDADPYDPQEEDPAKSRALESSLWELQVGPPCGGSRDPGLALGGTADPHLGPPQTLQQHYHPDVATAASAINQALAVPEVSIAPLLELSAFEVRQGVQWARAQRGLEPIVAAPPLGPSRSLSEN